LKGVLSYTMYCRGIRGATTVAANTKKSITSAGEELLQKMAEANGVEVDDIACIWFTTSPDLNAEFPAVAARKLGWTGTALLCSSEIEVPGSLPMCLRILMMVNTRKSSDKMKHIYLKGAMNLRPDIATPRKSRGKS
jgi:chorismate mutase